MDFKKLFALTLFITLFACTKEDVIQDNDSYYFPPTQGTTWATKSPESLGWNTSKLSELKEYLIKTNTKSFMILVDGKIVVEEYFDGHTSQSTWQWNSAGKTLVSSITGIAQSEDLLDINQKVSDFIGKKWTSAPENKENLIQVRHLLTMTSGIDDAESELTIPSKLNYKADAGTRWAYHNIFQKLIDVVASASGGSYDDYFNLKLRDKIGMDGSWKHGIIFRIYSSNTRSMARFGILVQNHGKWDSTQIIPESFLHDAVNTSQNINPSYGYMWWLNGKGKYMLPGTQEVFTTNLVNSAPSDMFAAMGAEDQRLYLIPSKNMIVIRMGNSANPLKPSFAVSGFDSELWSKISPVFN